MTTTSHTSSPFHSIVSDSIRLMQSKARMHAHLASETVEDLAGVIATITPEDQLESSKTLAWSLSLPGEDLRPHLAIRTSLEDVETFYAQRMSDDLPESLPVLLTGHTTSWYAFTELSECPMYDVKTGEVTRVLFPLVLFSMDGSQGIASEIGWMGAIDGIDLAGEYVGERWAAYLSGLRSGSADEVVSLFAPWVQSSMRDYSEPDAPFVAMDGREDLRAYFQRLFESYEILSVDAVTNILRGWNLFHDLLITVRSRTDGKEFAFRVAEYLVFAPDGTFQGRSGFGTPLTELSAVDLEGLRKL